MVTNYIVWFVSAILHAYESWVMFHRQFIFMAHVWPNQNRLFQFAEEIGIIQTQQVTLCNYNFTDN